MNDKFRIKNFKKRKDYLLCVNSSGTALQTMDIHHTLCYGPSFIETWGLHEYADIIQDIWNSINLYEKTRGISRFRALLAMLNRINGVFITEPTLDPLEQWIEHSQNVSNSDLKEEITRHSDPLLVKALQWSQLIDTKIDSIEIRDKPPFQFVEESLQKASEYFDIAIISGASQEGLIDEWSQHNLLCFVDVIGSQDEGSKRDCISRLIDKGYDPNNVIMIGDVISDYTAANQNGALFYPIIIHDETSSWSMFKDYYIDKIIHRDFTQFQSALISMFCSNFDSQVLQPTKT